MLVFSPTFLQAQPTPQPLEARPAETCIRSESDISKTVSQKKASNGYQRCCSSSSFLLGSFYCSPVYWDCMVSEGNTLSGLPCRSRIWSWWLCDSLGWGIAVSAEQETRCWSMGLFRQAYVQRSYGMVPLCCSKLPFLLFHLLITTLLFSFSFSHTQQWKLTCCQPTVFCSTNDSLARTRNVMDLVEGEK